MVTPAGSSKKPDPVREGNKAGPKQELVVNADLMGLAAETPLEMAAVHHAFLTRGPDLDSDKITKGMGKGATATVLVKNHVFNRSYLTRVATRINPSAAPAA